MLLARSGGAAKPHGRKLPGPPGPHTGHKQHSMGQPGAGGAGVSEAPTEQGTSTSRGGPAQLLPSPGDQRETLQEPLLDTMEYGAGEPHRTRPLRSRTLGHSRLSGRHCRICKKPQNRGFLAQASQARGAESVSTRAFRARGAWHAVQPREQTGQNL